jgi:hypothetical protein
VSDGRVAEITSLNDGFESTKKFIEVSLEKVGFDFSKLVELDKSVFEGLLFVGGKC